jgi:uncharacterized membrane protein YphA (DoxX/SURF4 family)
VSHGSPLRLVLGLTVAAYGARKLLGPGPRGTAGSLDSLAYRAPLLMGPKAGLAEFGGGLLAALLVRSSR